MNKQVGLLLLFDCVVISILTYVLGFCNLFGLSGAYFFSIFKVRRAGLNVEFAPDQIAYQLNVRDGALILKVN
jgi:hypothetical protein